MKERIIQYCQTCSLDDLENMAKKYHINCTKEEIKQIDFFIKNNIDALIEGREECFLELQKQISHDLYQKLYQLYKNVKNPYL